MSLTMLWLAHMFLSLILPWLCKLTDVSSLTMIDGIVLFAALWKHFAISLQASVMRFLLLSLSAVSLMNSALLQILCLAANLSSASVNLTHFFLSILLYWYIRLVFFLLLEACLALAWFLITK